MVVERYFDLSEALAADRFEAAVAAANAAAKALEAVDRSLLKAGAHGTWAKIKPKLGVALGQIQSAKDIGDAHKAFVSLSSNITETLFLLGPVFSNSVYELRCPMALGGTGANWLQKDQDIRNPYLGAEMLKCGEVIRTIAERVEPRGGEEPRDE
ncbi:MAG: DUF3347 domain-containing protein [Kiritimatiellia bacterium]